MDIRALRDRKQLRCVEASRLLSLPHTKKAPYALFPNLTRDAPPIHPLTQRCFLFKSESVAQFKMIGNTFVTVKRYRLRCFSTDSCGTPAQTCQEFWAGLPWFLVQNQASSSKKHSEKNIKIPLTTWNLFLSVFFFEVPQLSLSFNVTWKEATFQLTSPYLSCWSAV